MEYLAHSAQKGFPVQTYAEHVRNVQKRAMVYAKEASRYCKDSSSLIQIVSQAAEWHDLGKLDEDNQEVLSGSLTAKRLPINHVDAGTKFLLQSNADYSAVLVYSHHRGLPDMAAELCKEENAFRDENKEVREKTEAELTDLKHLHEMIIQNGEPCIDSEPAGNIQIFLRIALSCLADADHSDTSEHYGASVCDDEMIPLRADERLEALDHYVQTLNQDDERGQLRSAMYADCRNSFICGNFVSCDSPVGSGKTTAVMAHLLQQASQRGARRVFVILPYTNIIRQSVDVYRKALVLPGENPEAVVAELHHRADFEDETLRKLTALWRAPVIVTTAVAFFETIASNRPSTLRRFHELPGSVIFVDEAHAALPLRLLPTAWHWMNVLANEWGCYWVLASGSLVRFWQIKELTSICPKIPELVSRDLRDQLVQYENRRIEFQWRKDPLSRLELENWVSSVPGPRILIMNTVQSAAVIAEDLYEKYGRLSVEHLSTALNAEDRKKTINRVNFRLKDKNDTDWTLVATSCVEAGVDFSFRTGFREISSTVSLLQTAGRISRSGEYPDAEIWSFSMQDDPYLKRNPGVEHSAAILSQYFEKGFDIQPALSTRSIRDELIQYDADAKKRNFLIEKEESSSFETVANEFHVIEDDAVPVIVDDWIAEQVQSGYCDWNLIQKYSVSIARYRLELWNVNRLGDGLYQWTLGYNDFIGYMAGIIPMLRLENHELSI